MLTIGAKDHMVMQWKCVYDAARESGDEGGLSCEDSDVDKTGYIKKFITLKKKHVVKSKIYILTF